jgi:PII-like signaling protein
MEAAMTRLTGSALRVTIFIGENDTWHHKPLYTEIVHRAHAAGLAGASVFRGIEGFGASSLIHTSRLLSLSEDLPVAIVIVDSEERVRAFLPRLDELVTEGLVILDDCEVIRYVGRGGAGEGIPRNASEGTSRDTPDATDGKGDAAGKGEKSL